MADLYTTITKNPLGKAVTSQLGLPQPTRLRRGRTGPSGPIVLGVIKGASVTADALEVLGQAHEQALVDTPESRTEDENGRAQPPAYPGKIGALIVDASNATQIADLEQVRALVRPALKALESSARLIIIGADPTADQSVEHSAVTQALEGITRSLGKEMRKGGTANLVRIQQGVTGTALASTLSFLLEGRSAYVSGQPIVVGASDSVPEVVNRPLEGQIVVVTGAARGIGAGIAETLARDGASIVAVDIPAAGDALAKVTNNLGGTALQLDITGPEAGQRIVEHVASRFGQQAKIYGIVHNAGITRDKLLANTDEQRWGSVLDVNLAAQLRINDVLLTPGLPGGLTDGGRIVGVASTSGIAGNRGQTNYAASKAGVIGVVRSLSGELNDREITVNAVAPGFIETEMTGKIPAATREFARRFNSVQQGGLPVDVAEAIGYFLDPASQAVSGQVLRVCGQSQIGA